MNGEVEDKDVDDKNFILVRKNGSIIIPKNVSQQKMTTLIQQNNLLFALGPAGTGKTYMAIALASKALKEKYIKKIILTRPAVEAGENLGFLPGDLYDKLSPYMKPLYDSLDDIFEKEKLNFYLKNNQIEIVPLAFMRGRTLDNAFVILDEAQNTTIKQMKMFLTRMGEGSRMVITGDRSQIDLPNGVRSGLLDAESLLATVSQIGFNYFTSKDVVRHPLVAKIIEAYENRNSK
jgi:phosphate starvation-inducible PhoH-like protein